VFSKFGVPRQILSDRGPEFESELFTQLLKWLEIDKLRSSPYKPSTNGMVERFHRTLNSNASQSATLNAGKRAPKRALNSPIERVAKKLTNHHQVVLTNSQELLLTPVCGLVVALALTAAIERSAAEASDVSTSIQAGSSTDAVAPMDLNEIPPMALNEVTAAVAVLATVGADTNVSADGVKAAVAKTNASQNEVLPTAAAALAAAGAVTGSEVERKTVKVTKAVSANVTKTTNSAAINDGASTSHSYAEVCARKTHAVVSTAKSGPKVMPKVNSAGSLTASSAAQRPTTKPEASETGKRQLSQVLRKDRY